MRLCATASFLPLAAASAQGDPGRPDAVATVTAMPGLVAFWTFGEEAGHPRLSVGTKEKHRIIEVGGPIARAEGGPFSGYSADLNGNQYFHIPYAETGDLNILSEGGVTRRADGSAFPWCADYAATKSEVPEEVWCTLGFTYDSKYIRAYINGALDARPLAPVKDRRDDRYFTREGRGGKDRGMNPYYNGRGIFRYDPALHAKAKPGGGSDFTVGARYAVGTMLGEATKGKFGGLAVFDRAITDEEMKRLHDAADIVALK